jgi:trk system potassium uptake protein TrkA
MYIVIIGGGKIGEYLANTMLANRHRVAIIELSEKKIDHLALKLPQNTLLIAGDGCDSVYQGDAGASQADIVVATTGADDTNLVACEVASLVFGVPRTIARINNPKNERIFRKIGIEAVSSTTVISRLIEQEVTEGAVHAIMSMTVGDLVMTEVTLPSINAQTRGFKALKRTKDARHASMRSAKVGKRVADLHLPEDSLLVAKGSGEDLAIVTGQTVLQPGDVLIIASKRGVETKVRDYLLNLWDE